LAGAPLYFGALRLAKYNVGQLDKPLPYFEGLPSPMSAMVVVSLVLYYSEFGHGGEAKIVLPVIMATSILMVSPIRYPKPPHLSLQKGWGNTLYIIGIIGLVISGLIFGSWVLLPGALLYVLSGLIRWLTRVDYAADLQSLEKEA
jgi:CDP-diacylglycerol--serine O-phosphatidyltransferase